jgi:hypothetical protein
MLEILYLKVSRGHFEWQEDEDGEPVEHVVHRGRGEGALEHLAVADLRGRFYESVSAVINSQSLLIRFLVLKNDYFCL